MTRELEHRIAGLHDELDQLRDELDELRQYLTTPLPDEQPDELPDDAPEPPARNASTEEWATFVESLGEPVDEDATRSELIARWDELSA